jgi:hypothetical protein
MRWTAAPPSRCAIASLVAAPAVLAVGSAFPGRCPLSIFLFFEEGLAFLENHGEAVSYPWSEATRRRRQVATACFSCCGLLRFRTSTNPRHGKSCRGSSSVAVLAQNLMLDQR